MINQSLYQFMLMVWGGFRWGLAAYHQNDREERE